ncbi:hypothetical protein AVEN_54801-1 [Araneus ventricosus]|uniref:Uncharacterized protein n=1 Tax=Araneus ventricosus TaxID=182803 RepID=A0A4Y2JDL2_ARAVE|nr:hypothetical protein AVEN_54801-1 [Araneus ventricosus]
MEAPSQYTKSKLTSECGAAVLCPGVVSPHHLDGGSRHENILDHFQLVCSEEDPQSALVVACQLRGRR